LIARGPVPGRSREPAPRALRAREALAAQTRYGYKRMLAGMYVVPQAMEATAAYYAVQEARNDSVQGAGA
jgi:hypothetical protein